MARHPFPKQSKTVSINVREVSKELHRKMRILAFTKNCSLGSLYDEAIRLLLAKESIRE